MHVVAVNILTTFTEMNYVHVYKKYFNKILQFNDQESTFGYALQTAF